MNSNTRLFSVNWGKSVEQYHIHQKSTEHLCSIVALSHHRSGDNSSSLEYGFALSTQHAPANCTKTGQGNFTAFKNKVKQ